jgi:hypothetical protein
VNQLDDTAGLTALLRIIGAYEVNAVLNRTPGDVPYVAAVGVPDASQVCCVNGKTYDVWRHRRGKLEMTDADIAIGDAANVVIMEYMREKVRRSKRANPKLRGYSDDVLLAHLLKGYQGQQDASA